MALSKDFNPRGVLVARKSGGLALGGRRYAQGEAIADDCISMRKKQQLYKQNLVCHPHEVSAASLPAADPLTEVEKTADAEAKASRDALEAEGKEVSETNDPEVIDPESKGDDENSGEEGSSEEPSAPVAAPKKKRAKKKKKS